MEQEKVWDAISEEWNDFRKEPLPEVVDFLENKKGNLLDMGCGSGRNFIKFNGTIYGVDFSKKLLNFAEDKAKIIKQKVILKKSKFIELDFEDNFFDCAIFIRALHCVESKKERENSLKELFRVMKNNSKCLIEVWSKNHNSVSKKGKEFFKSWKVNGKKYERYTYIYYSEELKELLERVGFKIEKIWEDENICAILRKD